MKLDDIKKGFERISSIMDEKKLYLVELDQQNGDGDLGISMSDGFRAVLEYIKVCDTEDIGLFFNAAANYFNEAAPSSLGTVITFIMKGIAKSLKGKTECTDLEFALAFRSGLENVTNKTGSRPGQKTILDSLTPGVDILVNEDNNPNKWSIALLAAKTGSESTKTMRAVWGRAAYYCDNSIGVIDGGSVVGALIFEALVSK